MNTMDSVCIYDRIDLMKWILLIVGTPNPQYGWVSETSADNTVTLLSIVICNMVILIACEGNQSSVGKIYLMIPSLVLSLFRWSYCRVSPLLLDRVYGACCYGLEIMLWSVCMCPQWVCWRYSCYLAFNPVPYQSDSMRCPFKDLYWLVF